jgi:hypothetical protein
VRGSATLRRLSLWLPLTLTLSPRKSGERESQQVSRPHVPRRGHGPALEPTAPHPARPAASVPHPRMLGTPVPGLGLGAKGDIRAGAERRDVCPIRPPSRPGPRCQLDELGSSRLPHCMARLSGECSFEANISRRGIRTHDPQSYGLMLYPVELVVWTSRMPARFFLSNAEHTTAKQRAPAGTRRARTRGVRQGRG